MFSVEVDPARALMRISYSGKVARDQTAACLERMTALLPSLRPGFSLLNDLSGLEWMDVGCEPYIDQMMDLCNHAGIKKVIRIVPDPTKDIGLGIMSLFHYSPAVRIVTCSTLAEAQSVLGGEPAPADAPLA